MPMLVSVPKNLPKSIKAITKKTVSIDQVVKSSFSCAVKNSITKFSKNSLNSITKSNLFCKSFNGDTLICNATAMKTKNANTDSNKNTQEMDKNNNSETMVKQENLQKSMSSLDDSLTNLQWLTDVKVNDILEGKPIPYEPLSPAPSNSSEDGDDRKGPRRHYSDTAVDYRTNKHVKPPYSYAALIIMAMKSRSCAKMTLSEIYKWITDNFSFYKNADASWQNSIRHNLSLNKCFAKIPRNKGDPGKGGYWRIVPEFANKLLESNIRKRRTTIMDYNCQDIIKRQRLDLFENQLLCKIKPEIKTEPLEVFDYPNESSVHLSLITQDSSSRDTPVQADREQCRIDHPYGKSPYVVYNTTDEENIKEIANNLQQSSSHITTSINTGGVSNPQAAFSSAIVTDCIWSSHHPHNDNLTESMSKVTEELLEARNYSHADSPLLSRTLALSLNSSGGLLASPFCLSPPLSGDEGGLSDDLEDFEDFDETPAVFSDDIDLTVRGTSLTLFQASPEIIESLNMVKEEPTSPL